MLSFTPDEFNILSKKIAKTGMSRESYIRSLCNGKTPVELPPADYFALIREVRALGNSINQIAHKANGAGLLDAPMYRRHADEIIGLADKMAMFTSLRGGGA